MSIPLSYFGYEISNCPHCGERIPDKDARLVLWIAGHGTLTAPRPSGISIADALAEVHWLRFSYSPPLDWCEDMFDECFCDSCRCPMWVPPEELETWLVRNREVVEEVLRRNEVRRRRRAENPPKAEEKRVVFTGGGVVVRILRAIRAGISWFVS